MSRRRDRYRSAILAAVLVLLLVGQSVRGWQRLQSSVLVFVVRKEMAALNQAQSPRLVLRLAEAALKQAQRRDPAAVEPLAFHADLLFVAGRRADAEAAYRRAAAHEPRAETFFNWGTMLWRQGRTEEAVVQLRRGVALAPRFKYSLPQDAETIVTSAPIVTVPPLVPAPQASPSPPPR